MKIFNIKLEGIKVLKTVLKKVVKLLIFRNDNVVLTRVFSLRSYISEKRVYKKFISKIIFT